MLYRQAALTFLVFSALVGFTQAAAFESTVAIWREQDLTLVYHGQAACSRATPSTTAMSSRDWCLGCFVR